MTPLVIDARVTIPSGDLAWKAVRSSGPGGQNVNKVSSKVELRFDLAATQALNPAQKARLRTLFGKRIDAQGCLQVHSQYTRDQARNLEDARDKLALMVKAALTVPKPRRPTKPSRSAKKKRLQDKRLRGDKKRLRHHVRADD